MENLNKKMESEKENVMHTVERALDMSLIVLQNGGSTDLADRVFKNIIKGFNQNGAAISLRLDLATASFSAEGKFLSISKPVGIIGVNLARISQAMIISERTAKGEINLTGLSTEIKRIKTLATPYSLWILVAAAALTCAFFSQISKGDWGSFFIALIAGGLGQILRMRLQNLKFTLTSITLICGLFSACIAGAGLKLGFSQEAPSTLISSVFYMVPGLPLINGFVDVLTQKYLFVGLERIANAALLFLILAIAIAFTYTAFSLS